MVETSISSIVRVAMALTPEQRADLAATLLAGIDGDAQGGPAPMADRLWAIEVDFRLEDAKERGQIDPTWESLRGVAAATAARQVRVIPRAEADVRAIVEQYQRTRPLLVALLFESLDEAVGRVRREADALPRAPLTNPLKRVRRAAVHGFPLHVLIDEDARGDARILALARVGRPPAA
jgi:hypothetical protein